MDRLRQALAGYEAELAEIEAAERVIARYTGQAGSEGSHADRKEPQAASSRSANQPSVTEMIVHVLRSAERQGLAGLEPADAYDAILERGWQVNKDTLRARMWKMEQGGKLSKVENTSLYMLPRENKADDLLSREDQSSAFDPTSIRPVEPVPGGGT